MFDIIFCAARASESILRWRHIGTRITGLFDELSLPSLNRAITLTASFAGRDRLKFKTRPLGGQRQYWRSSIQSQVGYSVFVTLSRVSVVTPCGPTFRLTFGRC